MADGVSVGGVSRATTAAAALPAVLPVAAVGSPSSGSGTPVTTGTLKRIRGNAGRRAGDRVRRRWQRRLVQPFEVGFAYMQMDAVHIAPINCSMGDQRIATKEVTSVHDEETFLVLPVAYRTQFLAIGIVDRYTRWEACSPVHVRDLSPHSY